MSEPFNQDYCKVLAAWGCSMVYQRYTFKINGSLC